ncbi:MAG: YeeE/YedE family protein [Phycisphaerales bacterium]|nr:MAG: YeeE/YedE family protein [Phycisphaerales bacterium]
MAIPVVGLILGAIFGASLVLTGLTDPDRIIGSLRLKDFHALRTVVVSVLIALLGTWLLGMGGVAHLDIKPAAIVTLLMGGALVGIGLAITGFSPVTGLACAASGRIDALATVIGMLFGAHVYILIYPSIVAPLEKILNFGQVTLPQVTGTSEIPWLVAVFAAGILTLIFTRRGRSEHAELPSQTGLGVSEGNHPAGSAALTTDGLDAVGVLRMWKNFLFVVIVLSLVLLQAMFWLTNTGQVELGRDAGSGAGTGQSAIEANPSATAAIETQEPAAPRLLPFDLTMDHITAAVNSVNAVLIFASVLYVATAYVALSISIGGGLGGLGHVSRAFYLSVVVLILLLPWQILFGRVGLGVIYAPDELADSCMTGAGGTLQTALFYLRFTGTWALAMLVLILAQRRSIRWTRAALRQ